MYRKTKDVLNNEDTDSLKIHERGKCGDIWSLRTWMDTAHKKEGKINIRCVLINSIIKVKWMKQRLILRNENMRGAVERFRDQSVLKLCRKT